MAAVSCSDFANRALCQKFVSGGYPVLKVHSIFVLFNV